MVRATDVVAKGKLTLFGRTIVRLMETHMSNRTVCRKRVFQETECFKEDGTPRTGAQDEAHRLTSDFELSLGAHGGAVCSASLNRGGKSTKWWCAICGEKIRLEATEQAFGRTNR